MRNANYELAKLEIKDELIHVIISNALDKKYFSAEKGGEFSCPCCGKTLKAYRNAKKEWAINPLGHCADFGDYGYSCDTFGLVAAINGEDEKTTFRRLMSEKGINFKTTPENATAAVFDTSEKKREAEKAIAERAERLKREEESRDGVKALNTTHLLLNTQYGFDMPDVAVDLLYKRGIDPVALPAPVLEQIGYCKTGGFQCLDRDGLYAVEGIVFKLGENGAQVRRTNGESYIGKESKMARFQTFGTADPFLLDYAKSQAGAPLFITEGPFDTLSLYVVGAKAAIGALGAGNHQHILQEFAGWAGPVFVCFDTDAAGKASGAKLVKEFCNQRTPAYLLKLAGQEHDINDNLQYNPASLAKRVKIVSMISDRKKLEQACAMISSADFTKSDKFIDDLLLSLTIDAKIDILRKKEGV